MIKNIILDVGGIFFDDRKKNVEAARACGIPSFVFNSIEDIKDHIRRK